MILDLVILLVSLAMVTKGADLLVEGASSIAKKLKVSELIIGLTIVAFGTSLPELIVSIVAGVQDKTELTLGNMVGSNIANIFLILGITAIIAKLKVESSTVTREIPLNVLGTTALIILAYDEIFDGGGTNQLSRADGLVLLSFFAIFIYYTSLSIFKAKNGDKKLAKEERSEIPKLTNRRAAVYITIGIIGLALGGNFTVSSASSIASQVGISDTIIGLTIIAVGTSLPELVTSVVAAKKKKVNIVVGNVMGSNIFNILWILGLSSVIRPIIVPPNFEINMIFLGLSAVLTFIFLYTFKRQTIDRIEGVLFLLIYAVFIGINIVTAMN